MDVDFRTQAIHAGYEPLDNGRAAVPPIYASAAFDLGDAARGDALAGGDIDGTKLFSYVPNIGDARSLIVDPAHITHREVPAEASIAAGTGDNLIRLSIGLEDVNDLIADLDQAIAAAY